MRRFGMILNVLALWITAGCANFLYQGEITALDSYGKERHFVLYWTKTDPLIGEAKAGPAILLTECSPFTRISFDEQPDGLIFRGMPGLDRLPGQGGAVDPNLICGKVTNQAKWTEVKVGALAVAIFCEPVPNEFAVEPRNYLAVRPQPYTFMVAEKVKKWSFLGETLEGPPVPACRNQ
ncbi:MAG: hypothetical protein HYS23_05000 [Geobacter sp.]|nr:hypothetical protein [Geobacter sp.]